MNSKYMRWLKHQRKWCCRCRLSYRRFPSGTEETMLFGTMLKMLGKTEVVSMMNPDEEEMIRLEMDVVDGGRVEGRGCWRRMLGRKR
jgi:hypothetical protein